MKKLTITAAALALATTAAAAQDAYTGGGGAYLQVHGGAFFPTADGITAQGFDFELDNGTGYAVGALLGYEVANGLAVEGEWTYRSHEASLDEVTIANADDIETSVALGIGGDIQVSAFMLNGVYTVPAQAEGFAPYLGAGLGYAVPMGDADELDGAFAYQLKAGVLIPAGQGAIGAELAYLGTGDFEMDEANGFDASLEFAGVSLLASYRLMLR